MWWQSSIHGAKDNAQGRFGRRVLYHAINVVAYGKAKLPLIENVEIDYSGGVS